MLYGSACAHTNSDLVFDAILLWPSAVNTHLTPGCVLSHFLVFCYLLIWFGCILDGAKGLSLVLQLVVELAEFRSSIAGLLIDSFTAFVTDLLSCV